MKNIKPLFIAFVLICSSAIGQTARQKRAEGLYNNFSFVKAIDYYQKLIDKNDNKDYALRKLGDIYIMLRKPEEALSIYKQVVQQPNVPSEYYYYYAQVLRATGDYKESKVWMKKFRDSGNKADSRIKEFFKDGDLASGIFNSNERYILSKLNINTEFNDYGAVEVEDKIYLTSSREDGVSVKRLYAWDGQPLLDIFVTSKDNGSVASTSRVNGDVNTIQHDGSVTFNEDGTKMYFSRNNFHNNRTIRDSKGTMHVGIYSSDLIRGVWTNVKPINLNNPNYLVYNPSLSKDGTKLYFASDMPKGFGGTDIYVSEIRKNGSFGKPKNLGPIVNSEGNESFPFIHKEGVLYFSSDGHVGMGLLDVFATIKDENDEIVNIINLGAPINSKKDDFTYFLSDNGVDGYISSNRKGGVGNDDIYAFNRIVPLFLKGTIFDEETNEPLAGANVVLARKNGEEIANFTTGEDGSYMHEINRNEDFVLTGVKEEYNDISKDFSSSNIKLKPEIIVNLTINKIPRVDEFITVRNKLLIKLEPIYFDLNKSSIRPDAAIELNKVIAIMKKYPDMVIESGSHTDSRSTNRYNEKLSMKRALSTVNYIINRGGIDPKRITANGYGETQLVNRCRNRVKCTENEHQLNRRTEFAVIKMK